MSNHKEREMGDGKDYDVKQLWGVMWYWRLHNGSMWHGPHGSESEAHSDYRAFRERQRVRKERKEAARG